MSKQSFKEVRAPDNPRYLTKSRFVLAVECETKLFYTGKTEYADRKKEDPFLAALAEGGFQVGEMAKLYFAGGHEIETLEHEQALRQTEELLRLDSVILYEAAIRYRNLFIRVDILKKDGSEVDLIEVKSKSFAGEGPKTFLDKRAMIRSEWKPYLYDVAFQRHVLEQAFPAWKVRSFLLLADKRVRASVEGLNQRFLLYRDERGRTGVRVREGTTRETLGEPILTQVPVDGLVDRIHAADHGATAPRGFADWVEFLADRYRADDKIRTPLGAKCKKCEFVCRAEEERSGLKSGLRECWREQTGLSEEELSQPLAIDLWSSKNSNAFIKKGFYLLKQLNKEQVQPEQADRGHGGRTGLSIRQRQWLQVQKAQNADSKPYFDASGCEMEMSRWKYPLHFIDFETTMVAIPFNRGRRPYEGIAFQFSHHLVDEHGRIEHAGQYLNRERGVFPSFDFLRALKRELENDEGTIFRYAAHENTFLNIIYSQLGEADPAQVPDREDLRRWITTVARPTERNREAWVPGKRNMVDLCDLVKRYYFHPSTGGSNSLKKILPAVLNASSYLRERYSEPIYGRGLEIESLNFASWRWIRIDEGGAVVDPYELLPPIFEDADDESLDYLISDRNLSDGGAAMVAYARMQFSEMSDRERRGIEQALLKYCELDTMAMVMLWEYWSKDLLKRG